MDIAVAPREKRSYTLLVYMNGSDLESETGAGTMDLEELKNARADSENVNVVVFTGGANLWQTPLIPEWECKLFEVACGELKPLSGVGQRNMGDAGTLAAFIKFGLEYFPAERTSLILWDHGGGSVAGYGADEHFADGTLSLLEMEYAFELGGLGERKLDILGFDACLMASAEMAVVAARYADYLVASQALEPEDGWDYGAFSTLRENPDIDGAQLGSRIADAYLRSGGLFPQDELTLSVTNLSRAENLMGALGALMARAAGDIASDTFPRLAAARAGTKTFGDSPPSGFPCDMVDALDMARRLEILYPQECADLLSALNGAVVYNKYNSSAPLGGLSCFYLYSGAEDASGTLGVYKALAMSDGYTDYLERFTQKLLDSGMATPKPDRYMRLGGGEVALYTVEENANTRIYSAAARVSGEPCDLLVAANLGGSAGRVLGVRKSANYVVQKGYEKLLADDELELISGGNAKKAKLRSGDRVILVPQA
jgi:hypothetical protein